ncbi:hypothetical protein [Streptomyces platensis]
MTCQQPPSQPGQQPPNQYGMYAKVTPAEAKSGLVTVYDVKGEILSNGNF